MNIFQTCTTKISKPWITKSRLTSNEPTKVKCETWNIKHHIRYKKKKSNNSIIFTYLFLARCFNSISKIYHINIIKTRMIRRKKLYLIRNVTSTSILVWPYYPKCLLWSSYILFYHPLSNEGFVVNCMISIKRRNISKNIYLSRWLTVPFVWLIL